MESEPKTDAVAYRTRARCGRGHKLPTNKATPALPAQPTPAERRRKRIAPRRRSVAAHRDQGDCEPVTSDKAAVNSDDASDSEVVSTGRRGMPAPQPRSRAQSPVSSDSGVVLVCEKATQRQHQEDSDDEVIILEPPPKRVRAGDNPAPAGEDTKLLPAAKGVRGEAVEGNLDDDEELRIVGVVGQVATRDLAHARPDCAEHRFNPGILLSNCRHCDQCYCYVCDVKASECEFWGTGRRDRDHANAHSGFSGYIHLRKEARAGNNALLRTEFDATGPLRAPPRRQIPPLLALGLSLDGGGSGPPLPFPAGPLHRWPGPLAGAAGSIPDDNLSAMFASLSNVLTALGNDTSRAREPARAVRPRGGDGAGAAGLASLAAAGAAVGQGAQVPAAGSGRNPAPPPPTRQELLLPGGTAAVQRALTGLMSGGTTGRQNIAAPNTNNHSSQNQRHQDRHHRHDSNNKHHGRDRDSHRQQQRVPPPPAPAWRPPPPPPQSARQPSPPWAAHPRQHPRQHSPPLHYPHDWYPPPPVPHWPSHRQQPPAPSASSSGRLSLPPPFVMTRQPPRPFPPSGTGTRPGQPPQPPAASSAGQQRGPPPRPGDAPTHGRRGPSAEPLRARAEPRSRRPSE